MNYTRDLWHSIGSIYDAILQHPFLKGLTDGSLPQEAFKFYVIQDAHYLRHFAQCLSIAAAKAPYDGWLKTLNQHSITAIEVERALHESFFQDFGLAPSDVYSTPVAPTNLAYTRYLLSTAYSAPFHEVLAAMLPCYWIYWEVGKELEKQGSPNKLYQRWIDTYAAEEFAGAVREVLGFADQTADRLTHVQRSAMQEHFITTSRYEWMFWDMAYRQEQWPV